MLGIVVCASLLAILGVITMIRVSGEKSDEKKRKELLSLLVKGEMMSDLEMLSKVSWYQELPQRVAVSRIRCHLAALRDKGVIESMEVRNNGVSVRYYQLPE